MEAFSRGKQSRTHNQCARSDVKENLKQLKASKVLVYKPMEANHNDADSDNSDGDSDVSENESGEEMNDTNANEACSNNKTDNN